MSIVKMETRYPNPLGPTKTRIGWIGIGVMGSAMATRLLSAGYSLTVYARTPSTSKSLKLQSLGARLAPSPSDLARQSDVVFTMIGHPSDVREIVLGDRGLLSGIDDDDSGGLVLVDHTSSHPKLAAEIFDSARRKGCWSVDAPVSGGDIGAANGKLAILAGGDEEVVKWLTPLFDLMGRLSYMGKAGCGQSWKIANQIAVGGSLLGLSEGLMFAKKAGGGLDLMEWIEAVKDGAAGSMVMELFGARMVRRDFEAGGFAEYMVKDLGMGCENGDGDGVVVLPGAAICKELFSGMVANGDGKLGTQGLVTVLERLNGLQI